MAGTDRLAEVNITVAEAQELVAYLRHDIEKSSFDYNQGDKLLVSFDELSDLVMIAELLLCD